MQLTGCCDRVAISSNLTAYRWCETSSKSTVCRNSPYFFASHVSTSAVLLWTQFARAKSLFSHSKSALLVQYQFSIDSSNGYFSNSQINSFKRETSEDSESMTSTISQSSRGCLQIGCFVRPTDSIQKIVVDSFFVDRLIDQLTVSVIKEIYMVSDSYRMKKWMNLLDSHTRPPLLPHANLPWRIFNLKMERKDDNSLLWNHHPLIYVLKWVV